MMMIPGQSQYAGDSESLQADVMRFMAIIAFCLIAILALVKNAEPAPPRTAEEEVSPTLPTPAPDPIAIEPDPVAHIASVPVVDASTVPSTVEEPAPELPTISEPVTASEPVTELPTVPEIPPVQPVPEPSLQITEMVERAAEPPAPQPAPQPIPQPTPQPAADQPSDEPGLILRFASDRDFLRLIARGDIKVYAYREQDVLSLSSGYRFFESPAPGQVYELLLSSIPAHIVGALRETRPDIGAYRWGIALPNRISAQIEQHLQTVRQGQLVIDRFGEVNHVAAS